MIKNLKNIIYPKLIVFTILILIPILFLNKKNNWNDLFLLNTIIFILSFFIFNFKDIFILFLFILFISLFHFFLYDVNPQILILISSFTTFFYCINKSKYLKSNLELFLIHILVLISIYIILTILYNLFYVDLNIKNGLYNINPTEFFSRSSGLSRLCSVLIIFLYFSTENNKYSKYLLFLFFCINILLASKINTIILFFILISFDYIKNRNINKLFKLFYLFIISFIIIYLIRSANSIILINDLIYGNNLNLKLVDVLEPLHNAELNSHGNIITLNGRLYNWINSINSLSLMGNGLQSDRLLINNSTDNGYIYILLCFGIGGLFLIYKFLKILTYLFKIDCKNKYLPLIFFFLIRAFFENSFFVYSFDFIIISICIFILLNLYEKNNYNNPSL